MCSRLVQSASGETIRDLFSLSETPNTSISYNIWPGHPVLAIASSAKGRRVPVRLHWAGATEDVLDDSFCHAGTSKRRLCVVPVTGFYEWARRGSSAHPYVFKRTDDRPFGLAALRESGGLLDRCTILMRQADEFVAPVHERMPVLLEGDAIERWLGAEWCTPDALATLLEPRAWKGFARYAVSARVKQLEKNDLACLDRVPVARVVTQRNIFYRGLVAAGFSPSVSLAGATWLSRNREWPHESGELPATIGLTVQPDLQVSFRRGRLRPDGDAEYNGFEVTPLTPG